jgi:iron(III) transport system substrate-binding protein
MKYCPAIVGCCAALAAILGCERAASSASQPTAHGVVVVYAALDREFSEPILHEFTERTGIRVECVYDAESTKTVGLTNRIRGEAARPRCDVFWNNEILNTLRLKSEGFLDPCDPANAADYPEQFRDPDRCWFGFAARARVLIVNTNELKDEPRPVSVLELADPRWKGRIGIAKPLFGTTASHVACLRLALGADRFEAWLRAIKANGIAVLGGNKGCAEAVGGGTLLAALTDTDDAIAEVDSGRPVMFVFADSGPGQFGTLLLPNTVARIKGGPNPAGAVKLIDFLLSPEVEARLAKGPSAQIPLNRKCSERSRVGSLADLRIMQVDFGAAAEQFDAAARAVEATLLD